MPAIGMGLSFASTLAMTLSLGPPALPADAPPPAAVEAAPTAPAAAVPAPAAVAPAPVDDAPIIVVSPPPAPAPAPVIVVAPAPVPPPAATWGPAADVSYSGPALPPPPPAPAPPTTPRRPMAGIGLMIGGAALFTVGLSNRIGRVDLAATMCASSSRSERLGSVTNCFDYYDPPTIDGADFSVGMAYGSSMVLTMIGAGALGQRHAWDSTYGGRGLRNPNSRYVVGAIFTGLGIASIASHFALVYTDAKSPCTSYECNLQRRAAWVAASDVGAFGLNVGFANFSWASNYRKNLARYNKMQLAVSPSAAPGSVGATVSGRF